MISFKNQLQKELADFGLDYSEGTLEKLLEYAGYVLEENKNQNLTRIVEPEAVVTRHLVDSLVLQKWFPSLEAGSLLIDLGTGGGFPGVPLAITWPGVQVVLVDSERKKVDFLQRAARELALANVTAVHARAEELGRDDDYREQADLVVARSVAKLPVLLEYSLPLVKIGGRFCSYKGEGVESEVAESDKALKVLGGRLDSLLAYTLSSGDTHHLVVFLKATQTPHIYPRRPGIPQKRPLS
ncbi:MAG: 16S rRNA (guanine(527)-N(7))-methyltransferase RsmG [Firmicutes bacterium]|nr:16S rRNA (guanine(527)-N(7))-methyltransferase RsmG [Bacillota bacterium]